MDRAHREALKGRANRLPNVRAWALFPSRGATIWDALTGRREVYGFRYPGRRFTASPLCSALGYLRIAPSGRKAKAGHGRPVPRGPFYPATAASWATIVEIPVMPSFTATNEKVAERKSPFWPGPILAETALVRARQAKSNPSNRRRRNASARDAPDAPMGDDHGRRTGTEGGRFARRGRNCLSFRAKLLCGGSVSSL